MNLGDTIRHGTKWLVIGGLGKQVLQFAFGVVLARLLLPEDFGLLVTVQIFTGFLGMVASGGMGEAIIQAKAVSERDFQTVFTVQLVFGLTIYLMFFIIAPGFASWFGRPIYEDLLRVSALSFLIRPFSNNPSIRLRRAMRFKETAVIGFVSAAFTSISSIIMAWKGYGVWSLVVSGMAGAILSSILFSIRAPWRPVLYYSRESVRRLGSYGIKSVTNELLVYFRKQAPNLVITRMIGPAAVGLYNKADSLAEMPVRLVAGPAYQTIFRALSKVQGDINQTRYLYFRTLTLLGFYVFPVFLSLAFTAESFIVGLYGQKWQAATWPFIALCVAAPFRVLGLTSGALIAARNRLGYESILQAQGLILLVAACLIVVPYGIHWVAGAVVLSFGYIGLRLCALGLTTIGSRWREVGSAFTPVLWLCTVEFIVLASARITCDVFGLNNPYGRLALVAGPGLAVYILLALFLPPVALRSEINRWRKFCRLEPLTS